MIFLVFICFHFRAFALVVVLDAGHGGKDYGYYSKRKYKKSEKELNLIMVKKIGKYLTQNIKGIKVIYTRTTDRFLTLDERVDLANKYLADIFISIHCNSSGDKKASGARVHIHNKKLKKDFKLAKSIKTTLAEIGKRRSLAIHDFIDRKQNLQVIQYTEMVSLLIELGFLSNSSEEKVLHTVWGQDHIAKAIAVGVKNFLKTNQTKPSQRYKLYKIQIAASKTISKNLKTKREKRLDMRVDTYKHINLKKQIQYHLVGHYHSREEAKINLKKIQASGFKSAFIVRVR